MDEQKVEKDGLHRSGERLELERREKGFFAGFLREISESACTLCRKRKLDCDGERPSCGNCSTHLSKFCCHYALKARKEKKGSEKGESHDKEKRNQDSNQPKDEPLMWDEDEYRRETMKKILVVFGQSYADNPHIAEHLDRKQWNNPLHIQADKKVHKKMIMQILSPELVAAIKKSKEAQQSEYIKDEVA
mmetsp:Transcript_27368/g.35882  ORF Transcript_27368/g.35882 Transcript_27368/m.35882 type:complete len:190 (+) Transcript_27368:124-693(+)